MMLLFIKLFIVSFILIITFIRCVRIIDFETKHNIQYSEFGLINYYFLLISIVLFAQAIAEIFHFERDFTPVVLTMLILIIAFDDLQQYYTDYKKAF